MKFNINKNIAGTIIFLTVLGLGSFSGKAYGFQDVQSKERRPYQKTIRTRMPPSLFQEWIQKEFKGASTAWQTDWQTFVVEDDPKTDEYLVIARSQNRKWAFGAERQDCEKPEGLDEYKNDVAQGGTPIHLDVIVGIKKNRSFFRYQVQVYEGMYPLWKNPCYVWNLPPGSVKDPFYGKNYNMAVYSRNLTNQVYELVNHISEWRPPKKEKKIPVMKGPGQEIIGGAAELLTDEEKKLSTEEQEKILKMRRKERR